MANNGIDQNVNVRLGNFIFWTCLVEVMKVNSTADLKPTANSFWILAWSTARALSYNSSVGLIPSLMMSWCMTKFGSTFGISTEVAAKTSLHSLRNSRSAFLCSNNKLALVKTACVLFLSSTRSTLISYSLWCFEWWFRVSSTIIVFASLASRRIYLREQDLTKGSGPVGGHKA